MNLPTYKNSTELANLSGVSLTLADFADASLRGKLNTFYLGNTGDGKTQIVKDVSRLFGDHQLFLLGRNDMDTRELFQHVNPEFLRALRGEKVDNATSFKELSEKVQYHFIGVDELPNCVPAVRAQLFNIFDGFIEIDGRAYPLGGGYNVGMATGNIGRQFTESSNDLGRALRDRMHLIIDVDYFPTQPSDTLDILVADRNPRVSFDTHTTDTSATVITAHDALQQRAVPAEKYLVALYLRHGLDYLAGDKSKIGLKDKWPTAITGTAAASDEALVLPLSHRAAKSVLTLSQALDSIVEEKGGETPAPLDSMLTAYKFVGAYSGILNDAAVDQNYNGNPYAAMNALNDVTRAQFEAQGTTLAAAVHMASKGKIDKKILDAFTGRWGFAKDIFRSLAERYQGAPK